MDISLKFQKGFTLLELLIVIAVLGVLAGVVLVSANPVGQYNKGRDGQRKSDLRQLQSALEFYRTDAGRYPPAASLSSCGNGTSLTYTVAGNTVSYLNKIPCDPSTDSPYQYSSNAAVGNTNYCLRACLQIQADKDRDQANATYGSTNNPTISGCTLSACGSSLQSYTLTNP